MSEYDGLYIEQAAEIDRLRAELAAAMENISMANGCLNMIREWCEANGEDMSETPAMMYPEACHNVVAKERRTIAALRNLCGEQLLRIHQLILLVQRDRIAAEKAGAPVPNHYRQWLHELYEQKDRLKAAAEDGK